MVQITGKYEPVENINVYEFLVKMGVPEDEAKAKTEKKSPFEIVLDGNKLRFTSGLAIKPAEFVLGEEGEEILPPDIVVKSIATLDGNVITVKSSKPEVDLTGSRTLTFTDSGLEMKIVIDKEGVPVAIRKYKRL
ncbi:fatty acid binding protein 1-A, liver-like [Anoplophora glabripennis]|nr:fatty acid binding protein 1-A, liver-like isoform X2 [Anoplophora glabripennis]XP_018570047.1 fatty acid binding protein 1-A, liver-like [Anoplophora glabripennis]